MTAIELAGVLTALDEQELYYFGLTVSDVTAVDCDKKDERIIRLVQEGEM